MILISVISLSLYAILAISVYRSVQTNKHKTIASKIELSNITVVIPFRNEDQRLIPLLKSINASQSLPKEIIFVDDHSSDASVKLIIEHLKIANYRTLSSQGKGKKMALHTGIYAATTSYILTLDADVSFNANYFHSVGELTRADMHILPVVMTGNALATLDIYALASMNHLAKKLKHPIVASGANLLFNRDSYLEVNTLDTHKSIASGDDQFLLRDFNQNSLDIAISTYRDISISTPAPESLTAFINQRLRWISKTPAVKDSFASKLGTVQLAIQLLVYVVIFMNIYFGNYWTSILVFSSYSILSFFYFGVYLKKIGKQRLMVWIPMYLLLFPIYSILIFFAALTYQPSWKGRMITSR